VQRRHHIECDTCVASYRRVRVNEEALYAAMRMRDEAARCARRRAECGAPHASACATAIYV